MASAPTPKDDPTPAPISPPPPKRHPLLGKTLARCVVGEKIGRGATSSVYRARFTRLDRDIALKVLGADRAGDAEARLRFIEEAKAVAKVAHENIVKVLDVVEDQGYLCILMELVDGESVQDLIDDNGPLPAKRALKFGLDVARALEAAHEEEIVHRDIKPANFIVERKSGVVKVVDFGLASKGANNRVGTPLYMSPEAAQGKRIDEKSDIYALGVSLYQMLTGQHPFTGTTVKDILAAHVNEEPAPPSKVRPDLGTKYDKILGKLLVKAKGYRPSASDVVAMLEPLVDEPKKDAKIAVARAKAAGAKRSSTKKSPVPIVLGIVGAAAVIALLVVLLGGDPPKPPAPEVKPPVVAPQPAVDPAAKAKQAYLDAEAWAVTNRDDAEGIVKRWTTVEHETQGTEWSKRAAEKRAGAEKIRDQRRRDQDQADKEAQDRKNRDARRLEAYGDIPKLIAACDFETAAEKVRVFGAPPGTTQKEWDRKGARLAYLANPRNWHGKLDEALKDAPVRASKVKPSAAPDEQIVGAASTGLVTDAGGKAGKIPWEEIKPDVIYKQVLQKVLSQAKAENQLLFAVFTAETGLPKLSEDAVRYVNDLDQIGDVRDQLKHLFLTEEEKQALENPTKDDE